MKPIAERILDDFFQGKTRSFRECYMAITGDLKVTGQLDKCDPFAYREAAGTSSFAELLGEAIHRQMVAEYRQGGIHDIWRRIATVSRVSSFRPEHRVRWGGFGDLPAVAEGADYVDSDTPDDEMVSYSATKRGRLFGITVEAVKSDDVGLIRQVPTKLAAAAKRTLARFVLNMIRDNAVTYDGTALFTAGHGNLGSSALSAVSLTAGRLAISKQKEFGTQDPMNARARSLLVPLDLEEMANDLLFNRGPNQDKSFLQRQNLEVVPVWYWTDINDWALSVAPEDYPTIEVGFLEENEEPEVFVDENPSAGSLFARDVLTYKIRHIYGGAVVDYRGMYKAVVA